MTAAGKPTATLEDFLAIPVEERFHEPVDGGPGGWWFATEVEVLLSTGDAVRPDIVE